MAGIDLDKLDIFDEEVENLSEENKDRMIERAKYLASLSNQPTLPCECSWCQDWIDTTDLHYKIGFQNPKVICMKCAEFIFEQEDKKDETNL